MCGHCGCGGVQPIGELMAEHTELLDRTVDIRKALDGRLWGSAIQRLAVFTEALRRHVEREETGLFRALHACAELADEVAALEGEHEELDKLLGALHGAGEDDLGVRFERLVAELAAHIEREDHGIFPVSVVTLGADGWDLVDRAHAELPTFLRGARS